MVCIEHSTGFQSSHGGSGSDIEKKFENLWKTFVKSMCWKTVVALPLQWLKHKERIKVHFYYPRRISISLLQFMIDDVFEIMSYLGDIIIVILYETILSLFFYSSILKCCLLSCIVLQLTCKVTHVLLFLYNVTVSINLISWFHEKLFQLH